MIQAEKLMAWQQAREEADRQERDRRDREAREEKERDRITQDARDRDSRRHQWRTLIVAIVGVVVATWGNVFKSNAPPVVHVAAPPPATTPIVNVAAPPPAPAPVVNVQSPAVTVQPAEVNVQPPNITILALPSSQAKSPELPAASKPAVARPTQP